MSVCHAGAAQAARAHVHAVFHVCRCVARAPVVTYRVVAAVAVAAVLLFSVFLLVRLLAVSLLLFLVVVVPLDNLRIIFIFRISFYYQNNFFLHKINSNLMKLL